MRILFFPVMIFNPIPCSDWQVAMKLFQDGFNYQIRVDHLMKSIFIYETFE